MTEPTTGRTVRHAVIAPRWRHPFRPPSGLGARPLLRWQVLRETRGGTYEGETGRGYVWGYEHHSSHWTRRAARAAFKAMRGHDD